MKDFVLASYRPMREAETNLLNMMQQRKELGLSTDGVLINTAVNRIQ